MVLLVIMGGITCKLENLGSKILKNGSKVDVLLIVTDGQLKMMGNNTVLLVIMGSVTCKLKNLGSKILKNGGKVDILLIVTDGVRGCSIKLPTWYSTLIILSRSYLITFPFLPFLPAYLLSDAL